MDKTTIALLVIFTCVFLTRCESVTNYYVLKDRIAKLEKTK